MSLKSLKNQTLRNKSTINSVNLTGGASTGPVITSIIVTDSNYNNLDDTALLPAGGYAKLIGSGFASGCSAYFNGSSVTTTFVSATEVRVVIPATTAGTYNVMLFNPSTAGAIYLNLGISSAPTFTTSAGSLGTSYETTAVSTSIAATGDAPITYALYSGSLPTGVTLASNGTLSGTSPVEASSTTYSFVVQATDAQLQDTTRSFSLTISTDIVTWSTPAADFAYTLAGNEAMSNVSLSAASAAGYNITYAANTLPTGVSLSGNTIFGTPTVEQTVYTALTATAATTGRSATRYVSWSIALGDAYWKYNTLLIPGASTTFVDDASTNNFAVTINGDTKPNNFNPYTPGYYSNYFDGTGDYLSTTSNAALNVGAGAFTVEAWIYPNTLTNYGQIVGQNVASNDYWMFTIQANGVIRQQNYYNIQVSSDTGTIVTGKWQHVVLVRDGSNNLSIFVNGIRVANTTDSTNWVNTSVNYIGAAVGDSGYFNGYISNVRCVKGTAVYDPTLTTLTVPTTPLTAIANTSLLTCQSNRFIDNSTNNFTLTVNGNTTVNSFDPFIPNSSYSSYGSGYFDGTGDYLSVPYNSALNLGSDTTWTMEYWVYFNASLGTYTPISHQQDPTVRWCVEHNASTTLLLFDNSTGTTFTNPSTLAPNTWYHIAFVRDGTTVRLYINGAVSVTTTTSNLSNITSGPLSIGRNEFGGAYFFYMNGYIADVRLVKGTSVYTSAFAPPTAPLTAISGTSLLTLQNNQSVNNNVFLDNSTNNFLVTRAGNATQGTFSPYGGNWSASLNGTTDYLSTPYNTAFDFNTGNFTVECWFNHTGASFDNYPMLFGLATGASSGRSYYFYIDPSGFLNFGMYPDGVNVTLLTATTACTRNVWNHTALVRSSGTTKIYLNGVVVATAANQNFQPYLNAGSFFNIGREASFNGSYFPGYISNFRIVKGTALYTTTFTPSTTPLTPTANTRLLTCQSSRFIDNSINNLTITKAGDTSVQRFSPFNPSSVTPTSYSGYFDGTGDYLTVTNNVAFTFTNDFTIECWIYSGSNVPSNDAYPTIFSTSAFNSTGIGLKIQSSGGVGTTGVACVWNNGSQILTGTTVISNNNWYHLSVSRSGTSMKLFVNGVAENTITNNTTFTVSAGYPLVGGDTTIAGFLTGYVSNLRVVKGTAVYTSNFTPPTSPLTAIANTSLLTCQSTTFIDNSTNNFTISAFGNSQPTQQNPFGFTSATTNGYTVSTIGGSGYFDGTGDTLNLASSTALLGAGNFTVDFWVNLASAPTGGAYYTCFAYGASGSVLRCFVLDSSGTKLGIWVGASNVLLIATTAMIGQWAHIALTRVGSTLTAYINGVNAGTASNSTNFNAGQLYIASQAAGTYLPGYISDFRIVVGTSVYTSNFVPPSAPLTAVQNTVLLTNMTGAGIYDAAMMNDMETVGGAKLSTAVTKFGGSSVDLTSGATLTLKPNLYFANNTDFTIEGWINITSFGTNNMLMGWNTANFDYVLISSAGIGLNQQNTYTANWSVSLSSGTWFHLAITRSSGVCRCFVNGIKRGSDITNTNNLGGNVATQIGNWYTSPSYPFNGYLDDFRITMGYARYTSNFTPPTSALQIK